MLGKLHINQWSSIEKTLDQKPNILLSQFAMIAVITCLIQVVNDSVFSNFYGVLFDILVGSIFLASYFFNENRRHLLAKFTFVVLGTGMIFIFASIIPKESGVYLLFMPIITVNFLIFSNEESKFKYLAILYIILLLFILEITHYHPFGDINVTNGKAGTSSFYVNMTVGVFALVFSLYNIEMISRKVDQKRLVAEEALIQKNKDLEKVNEELDRFVYSASHDLKSPLSSIQGLVNIAKYEVKDEVSLVYFDKIEERVQRLVDFIKDVIAISRNARVEGEMQETDLNGLIHNIVDSNERWEMGRDIEFEVSCRVEEEIAIDKSRVEIMLNNLISNAVKYHNPKQKSPKVEIEVWKEGGKLHFKVSDNGIGIPQDIQSKIFEMFFRGNNHSSEGSGLGLYIVKNVIDKLKGEIQITSQVGQGSVFLVSIPV